MTICKAMSGLFSCFRVKKHDRRSPSHVNRAQEVSGSRNRLSSLFLSEEVSPSKSSARVGSPPRGKDLKNQAKSLETFGTIPKTPAEIKRSSDKFKDDHFDEKPSKSCAIEEHQVDESPDQTFTPVKLQKKFGTDSLSRDLSPSSCLSSVHTSGKISTGSADSVHVKCPNNAVKVQANQVKDNSTTLSPFNSIENTQCMNKSVLFTCKDDETPFGSYSSGNIGQDLAKCKKPGNQRVLKPLPYPTPLNLDDAMQTPGTVYPANLDNFGDERARIRSQYVYSVSNITDSTSELKNLKGDDPNSHVIEAEPRHSFRQSEHGTLHSEKEPKSTSMVKESLADTISAAEKKPAPFMDNGYNQYAEPVSAGKPSFGKIHDDRPIIGIVATHWNEDDTLNITPKWWDGNGIPNSTNKYKEDQKVSWHATPFEERLEKALSEETLISQRGRPAVFDENEENDTAISKGQFSPPPAVSC